ncbi:MAG: hypothetical protein QOI53_2687 [Verrucomicrobiota bacterium]|jgi:hypothetical protein|nr:hypothetical protein [Verrucomicrobiota bacterium]
MTADAWLVSAARVGLVSRQKDADVGLHLNRGFPGSVAAGPKLPILPILGNPVSLGVRTTIQMPSPWCELGMRFSHWSYGPFGWDQPPWRQTYLLTPL